MPGMRVLAVDGRQSPEKDWVPLQASKTIYAGDLVVKGLASSVARLRLLATADITALYEDGSGNVCGIFGISADPVTSNSSGVISARPAPLGVTLDTAYQPIYQTPTIGTTVQPTSTALSYHEVFVLTPDLYVGGKLLETTTVTESLVGTQVGIDITAGVFTFSTAAATKVGKIVAVSLTDPNFNVSGGGGEVFVQFYSTFCQSRAEGTYAT